MLRLAVPAMLFAGLFLLPAEPAAAEPLCFGVTILVANVPVASFGPFCVPFDGPVSCVTTTPEVGPVAVVLLTCTPNG